MKMTMTSTFDGLVRALRWKAHALAEEIERDYVLNRDRDESEAVGGARRRRNTMMEDRDDRADR